MKSTQSKCQEPGPRNSTAKTTSSAEVAVAGPSISKRRNLQLQVTTPFNKDTYLLLVNSMLRQSLIKRIKQIISSNISEFPDSYNTLEPYIETSVKEIRMCDSHATSSFRVE